MEALEAEEETDTILMKGTPTTLLVLTPMTTMPEQEPCLRTPMIVTGWIMSVGCRHYRLYLVKVCTEITVIDLSLNTTGGPVHQQTPTMTFMRGEGKCYH